MGFEKARITNTFLGLERHGIPTFYIMFDMESGYANRFGGWDLRWDGNGIDMIAGILEALEIDSWEDLMGTSAHLYTDYRGRIISIGNSHKSKWADISKYRYGYD